MLSQTRICPLTLAFALNPGLEPLLLSEYQFADALPLRLLLVRLGCSRPREVEALVPECGIEGERLVNRVREDGWVCKQSRNRAPQLALKHRQQLERELALYTAAVISHWKSQQYVKNNAPMH